MNYKLELQIWELNEESLSLAHKIVSGEHPDRAKLYDGKYTKKTIFDSIVKAKDYWLMRMIFDFMCKMIQSKGFVMKKGMLFYVPVIAMIQDINITGLNEEEIAKKQSEAIKIANDSKNLYHILEISFSSEQKPQNIESPNENEQNNIEE